MKNKLPLIIVAVIFLFLVIAGGAYFMLSSKGKATQTNTATTTKPQTVERNAVKGTILSLLDGGKSVSCTVSLPDGKGAGTFYVASSKKFAGDITSKGTDGKDITTHMVSDGTYVYIWSAAMPSGFKMKLDLARSATENAQSNQAVNLNQNVDMQCGNWPVDDSKFTVPSNVEFRDMSQLLQQALPQTSGKTVTPGTQTGGTSPCDQITDPTAKAACTKALQGQGY